MTKIIKATVDIDLEAYNGADVWHDGKKRWIVVRVATNNLPVIDEILEDDDLWLYEATDETLEALIAEKDTRIAELEVLEENWGKSW